MNKKTPKVSVLMAVYNGAEYLDLCVQSILNQTFSDFEFIILDDGSADNSLDILNKYAKKDSRIKLISRENKGHVTSLNEMVQIAVGKYIARMDHDDIAMAQRLEVQVQFMDANKDVLVVGTAAEIIDYKGRYLTTLYPPEDNESIQSELLKGHCALFHPSTMIRTATLLKNGGYNRDFELSEDYNLWLELGEKGKLRNLHTPLIQYREHFQSTSSQRHIQQMELTKKACELAWKRRGIKGNFEAIQFRPTDKNSLISHYLRFGWLAFNSNEHKTALIYAVKILALKAWSIEAWKLLACGIFKKNKTHN